MKLAHLMVFVPDFERAKAFYTGVLGFPLKEQSADRLVFGCAGGDLVAFRCEHPGAPGDYARESRAVFVFEVPSIEAAMADLRRRGVRLLHDEPGQGPGGRYAAFVDPFGIVHEVQEPWPG